MELLEDLLEEARKLNASDLHITANQSVSLRIDGKHYERRRALYPHPLRGPACKLSADNGEILHCIGTQGHRRKQFHRNERPNGRGGPREPHPCREFLQLHKQRNARDDVYDNGG